MRDDQEFELSPIRRFYLLDSGSQRRGGLWGSSIDADTLWIIRRPIFEPEAVAIKGREHFDREHFSVFNQLPISVPVNGDTKDHRKTFSK